MITIAPFVLPVALVVGLIGLSLKIVPEYQQLVVFPLPIEMIRGGFDGSPARKENDPV